MTHIGFAWKQLYHLFWCNGIHVTNVLNVCCWSVSWWGWILMRRIEKSMRTKGYPERLCAALYYFFFIRTEWTNENKCNNNNDTASSNTEWIHTLAHRQAHRKRFSQKASVVRFSRLVHTCPSNGTYTHFNFSITSHWTANVIKNENLRYFSNWFSPLKLQKK